MKSPAARPELQDSQTARAIKACINGFVLSLFGLVPVIGLPFSIRAILENLRAAKLTGATWNPAERYLRAARWLAPLGFLSTAAFLLLIFVVGPAVSDACSLGSSGGG